MRRIVLETGELMTHAMKALRNQGQDVKPVPFTFSDCIMQIVESKRDGMTITEIRQCLRIQDLIAKANGSALLEDADWSYLAARLAAHQFPFACDEFNRLALAIEGAENVDIAKLE